MTDDQFDRSANGPTSHKAAPPRSAHDGSASFQAEVREITPRLWVTKALAAVCVGVFALMSVAGVPIGGGSVLDLARWGACSGSVLAHDGQWWRLLTHQFVHGGLIHMAFNVWCLMSLGPVVERLFGSLAMLAIFLICGIAGGLACAATTPNVFVVGASGAIFGIGGALLAFLFVHREAIPRPVMERLRNSTLWFVGVNLLFGFTMPNVANAAHVGGLVAGVLAGLLLQRAWPPLPERGTGVGRRTLAAAAMLGSLGLGGDYLASRLREDPTTRRGSIAAVTLAKEFNAYMQKLRPVMQLYDALSGNIRGVVKQAEEEDAPLDALQEHLAGQHTRMNDLRTQLDNLRPDNPELAAMNRLLVSMVDEQLWINEAVGRWLADPEVDEIQPISEHAAARDELKARFIKERDVLVASFGFQPKDKK